MVLRKIHSILPVLALLAGTPALAMDDCSPIRLDAPGGSMEHVSTRDQVGGTCFFEVATQLFDAYRMKNGADPHSNSSGFMAAMSLAKAKGNSNLDNNGEGGFVCDAFDFLVNNGAMNEDLYNKTYAFSGKDISYPISQLNYQRKLFLSRMDDARDQWAKEVVRTSRSLVAQDQTYVSPDPRFAAIQNKEDESLFMEKYGNKVLDYALLMSDFYVKSLFTDSSTFDYKQFFKDLFLHSAGNELQFLERIMNLHHVTAEMHNKLYGLRPTCHTTRYTALTSDQEVMSDINMSFSNGIKSYPLSINICSALYEGGRDFNPGLRTVGAYLSSKSCKYHAAILMGRRRNPTNNRCQYLIRNSSGANTCLENMSKDWNCEKATGAMWIDADKVSQATGRVEQIQ